MKSTSVDRRQFFSNMGHTVGESLQNIIHQVKISQTKPSQSVWIPVGRLSEMCPGFSRAVNVDGFQIYVTATEWGVTAEWNARRIALKTGPAGTVLANPVQVWPSHTV